VITARLRLCSQYRAAMLFLALLLALRALIPQGMMAAPDAAAGITVLLCDSSGIAGRIALPIHGKPLKSPQTDPCAFSVLAHGAADLPEGWIVAPAREHSSLRQPVAKPFLLRTSSHAHPPARAPPAAA